MAKRYPDRLAMACPAGWRDKCERLAAEADMGLAEWLRSRIRLAFEADRKAKARAGGK